jgi:type VI secretion system protein ImpB
LASIHDKLERIRKPRVHIKYEVEVEGALVEKELPFVVGVLGDFSCDSTEPPKPLNERKFVQIDLDNFDDVMARMAPAVQLRVENTLAGDGSSVPLNLRFSRLDDFEPAAIVAQVPALKALLETRNQLRDLLTKADRSADLEALLERVLQDSSELKKLAGELKLARRSASPDNDGAA